MPSTVVFQQSARGRFAPTPSGPLHFGSLVAALASALDARSRGGEWLLRIDDLDSAREAHGARDAILFELNAFGFSWDGPVYTQRNRSTRYHDATNALLASCEAFPCACSRRDIAAAAKSNDTAIYPGTCRNGLPPGRKARSIRLRVPDRTLEFDDAWAGRVRRNLAREVGDFVLWRADGIASYHLATVLDDADAGVTHVVRGADLLGSTMRQIYLQQALGLSTPAYAHLPLVRDCGRKLGKQTGAPRLDLSRPVPTLVAALGFLRQAPPSALNDAVVGEVWNWALAHWNPTALRAATEAPAA
ncbi:MAG: tRNA glutamyl-Q(34) synthetase GluQRS [Gammaproteobacteria bacterium]